MPSKNTICFSLISALLFPALAWACHPVLKCVAQNGSSYTAYFGFEGGEDYLPIGDNNKFIGATGCTNSGRNCGQGTKFVDNGPSEQDMFGSDSIVAGQKLLPVSFTTSVTWRLSTTTVMATTTSKSCLSITPTATRTATPTRTATVTRTRTATPSPTVTRTATPTLTAVASATPTRVNTPTNTPMVPLATQAPTAAPSNTPTSTPTVGQTETSTPTVEPTVSPIPDDPQQPDSQPTEVPTPLASPTPEIEVFDCNGVPNGKAVLDCCGVCGGDGTSCPELCRQIDNAALKKTLRRKVQKTIASILQRITREKVCTRQNKSAVRRKTETLELKKQLKFMVEAIEVRYKLCDTPFCTKTSFTKLNTEIELSVKRLVQLDKLSQRKAIKACCKGNSCNTSKSSGVQRSDSVTKILDDLPTAKCD